MFQAGGAIRIALPRDLSFAIRHLSPEEMEICMDKGSVNAAEFLGMSAASRHIRLHFFAHSVYRITKERCS